jgi:hypothetical protein
MRHLFPLGALMLLVGCGTSDVDADLASVHAVTMSGPAISWQDLRVHPVLAQRACAVSTLVNDSGTVVGYCSNGRQCRTMDWRPIADGCVSGNAVAASQQQPTPDTTPGTISTPRDSTPSLDLAQRR